MSTQVQATENMLKGERAFKTISYAITGDAMADLLAVINAVVGESILHPLCKAYVLEAAMKVQIAQNEWDNNRPLAPPYPTQEYGIGSGVSQNQMLNQQCTFNSHTTGLL